MPSGLSAPPVIIDTSLGAVPLNPPPGAQPTLPGSAQAVSRDGNYTGVGVVLSTNGGLCTKPLAISGFVVRGNSVQFERSSGTIAEDGALQMVADGNWIVGQFQGAAFRGEWTMSAPRGDPGCSYILNLARTGP